MSVILICFIITKYCINKEILYSGTQNFILNIKLQFVRTLSGFTVSLNFITVQLTNKIYFDI